MAKKIVGYIKLQVPAGKANPSPPIGPALGQRGLNIMEFCKAFNAATQNLEPGMPIPVVITAFADRSFTFVTKTPPASYFLKKAAGIEKGVADHRPRLRRPGDDGRRSARSPRQKMQDLNANDIEAAAQMIKARPARWALRWWSRAMAKRQTVARRRLRGHRPRRVYPLDEAVEADQDRRHGEVRRDRRDRDEPQRRPAQADQNVRGIGDAAARHRQDRAGRGVRPRRQGQGGRGRRRRHRRRRGPRREGPGRRDRFRPLHRHPGHDGAWSAGSAKSWARAG